MTAGPVELEPTRCEELFDPLGEELVALLRSLSPEDWERQTVCPAWRVRDLAAHLLDSACRRVSFDRDDYQPPPPEVEIAGYGDLIDYLNGLNADWVAASRRLSPRLITDLLETVEPIMAQGLKALDPWAVARFPVSWAGEEESLNWFDTARELTERWLHQQQIRLAVGAPPLRSRRFSEPVFATFLRVMPGRYQETEVPEGVAVQIEVVGEGTYAWVLQGSPNGWRLLEGRASDPTASIRLDEEPAWLMLTKGMSGEEARGLASTTGPEGLLVPFFGALAVMA